MPADVVSSTEMHSDWTPTSSVSCEDGTVIRNPRSRVDSISCRSNKRSDREGTHEAESGIVGALK
jgi:hypothetical protein